MELSIKFIEAVLAVTLIALGMGYIVDTNRADVSIAACVPIVCGIACVLDLVGLI